MPIRRLRFTGPFTLYKSAAQFELVQQVRRQALRAIIHDFQPHRIAEAALRQLALHGVHQILHFFVIDK